MIHGVFLFPVDRFEPEASHDRHEIEDWGATSLLTSVSPVVLAFDPPKHVISQG